MSAQVLTFPGPSQETSDNQEGKVVDLGNGFIKLPKDISHWIRRMSLGGRERDVLDVVIEKTIGFHKEMDWVSNEQLSENVFTASGKNVPPKKCGEYKMALVRRNILVQKGRHIGVNPRLHEWLQEDPGKSTPSNKVKHPKIGGITPKDGEGNTPESGDGTPPNTGSTKDTSPKERKEKDPCRAEARRRNAEFADQAKQVIEHLNSTCSRQYPTTGSSNTVKGVVARLKAGATVEQLKAVIDHKQWEWGGDAKMSQYLQPSTLFKVSKVEENIANAAAWLASGKAGGHSASDQAAAPAARDVMTDQDAMAYLRAGGLYRELSLAVKGRIESAFKARKLPAWMVSILDEQEAFHD